MGNVWFSRHRRLRRTRGRLAFVLVRIDSKFRRFGNGNYHAVRNWTESRWYIRIHYCPLLFLSDASRNRWQHIEVAVRCVITWLPPNRNSKRHRMSFAIQPQRKICCTFYDSICAWPRIWLGSRSCIQNKNDTPFSLSRWWPFYVLQMSLHRKCNKSYLHF